MLAPAKMAALQAALESEPTVLLAYLFGSVARGDDGPLSDTDVAVWTALPLGLFEQGAMADRLAKALGSPVDLVDLRLAPPLLSREIVAEGVYLLVRDPEVRFDFEQEAIHRYEDTRPLRAQQQQIFKELAARGRTA